MDMTGEERIAAPREAVWAALNDPEILKQCIPGCQSLEMKSPTELSAVVKIRIGPVSASFTGDVILSNINAPESYTIKILYGHEVEELRAQDIAYAITERTDGHKTYVTFDIDCLDPAFAPGTGTPEFAGLFPWQSQAILRGLGGIAFAGMDVVEVAPAYDVSEITALAAATVIWDYLGLVGSGA